MNPFEELFAHLDGGRVLDVATGEGGYINILQRYLRSYTSIIGVDTSSRVVRIAQDANQNPKFHFIQMDGEQLGFGTDSFNTVNISASLHHLENVNRVLEEMKRVLKSGGKIYPYRNASRWDDRGTVQRGTHPSLGRSCRYKPGHPP
jgi:ubiquinone/menaquinone biosynthesis C-methylase UbiE